MNPTVDLSNILFQLIKGLPWWFWVLIIISSVFGGSENIKRRRNYYKKDNRGLLDIWADNLIDGIKNIFKAKKTFPQQKYSQKNYPVQSHQTTDSNAYLKIDYSDFNISEIDKMTGREFEKYLERLFIKLGYSVNRVGTSWHDHRGDFGGDLIVEKDGIKTAIQAKCYNNYVGINSIREVLGAISYYQCQKGMVITNNYFSNDAKTQASISNIELWDRNKLTNVVLDMKIK